MGVLPPGSGGSEGPGLSFIVFSLLGIIAFVSFVVVVMSRLGGIS